MSTLWCVAMRVWPVLYIIPHNFDRRSKSQAERKMYISVTTCNAHTQHFCIGWLWDRAMDWAKPLFVFDPWQYRPQPAGPHPEGGNLGLQLLWNLLLSWLARQHQYFRAPWQYIKLHLHNLKLHSLAQIIAIPYIPEKINLVKTCNRPP